VSSTSPKTDPGSRLERAISELVRCANDSFTGNVTFDFSEGVAMLCRKTHVEKYAKPAKPGDLDGGMRHL